VLDVTDRHPVSIGLASLRGRLPECALLDGMIGAVRKGESRTLVRAEAER
jgi:hypothetical protein